MHIDRSKFLLLTASIAAGTSATTCGGSKLGDEPVKVATPIEVEPSDGNEPLVSTHETVSMVEAGEDRSLQEMCAGLEPPPGPHCESFHDTKADCSALIDGLDEESADKAVSCLAARSKTPAICRYDALETCFRQGIAAASPEPRFSKACKNLAQSCSRNRWSRGDVTEQSCGRALAAVKDHLEGEMISCMAEGCGLGSCVWRLR